MATENFTGARLLGSMAFWWLLPGPVRTATPSLSGAIANGGAILAAQAMAGRHGKPPRMSNFEALILSSEGVHLVQGDCRAVRVERGFDAIGTGGQVALGALVAGAGPREAVRIACELDAGSGGKIEVFKLRGGE